MISNTQITAQPEYDIQFWNAMRNKEAREDILAKGRDISTGTYSMPTVAAGKVMNEIEKESDFRKIATVIRAYKNGYRIFAKDCKDRAEFVAEGAAMTGPKVLVTCSSWMAYSVCGMGMLLSVKIHHAVP